MSDILGSAWIMRRLYYLTTGLLLKWKVIAVSRHASFWRQNREKVIFGNYDTRKCFSILDLAKLLD